MKADIRAALKVHPKYFFAWAEPDGNEYTTMICGFFKDEVIRKAEKHMDKSWRQIYKMGGRVVKVDFVLAD